VLASASLATWEQAALDHFCPFRVYQSIGRLERSRGMIFSENLENRIITANDHIVGKCCGGAASWMVAAGVVALVALVQIPF